MSNQTPRRSKLEEESAVSIDSAANSQRQAAVPARERSAAATASDVLSQRKESGKDRRRPTRKIPAKFSWHHRVLLSLQRRLLRKREVLRRDATTPLEPHSLDEADSATDEFDHDLALAQLSAKQDVLYEVNEALNRLADGRYGVCEASGRKIPPARLRVIPWARFTCEVEARLENRGQVQSTRLRRPATVRSRHEIWLRHPQSLEQPDDTEKSIPANDELLSEVYSPPGQRLIKKTPDRLEGRRPPFNH